MLPGKHSNGLGLEFLLVFLRNDRLHGDLGFRVTDSRKLVPQKHPTVNMLCIDADRGINACQCPKTSVKLKTLL